MSKCNKKYKGEIKIERILPYDIPIDWSKEWVGPFIRVISKEEAQKLYSEINENGLKKMK